MAKLTAWLVTIVGLLMLVDAGGWVAQLEDYYMWIYAVLVLVIGVGKLMRNYKK